MRKGLAFTLSVYFALLLLILVAVQAAVRWESHPLTPAFAMMEERSKPAPDSAVADAAKLAPPQATGPVKELAALLPDGETKDTAATPEPAVTPAPLPTSDAAQTEASPAAVQPEPSVRAEAALSVTAAATPKTVVAAVYGGAPAAAKFKPIPVLNYHSVAVDPGNIVVIHPDKFREQMQYLHDNGYVTLALSEFTDILEGKATAPAKAVLLTFDDGYADNYENAMPILKEFGMKATLFLSPGTIGDPWYLDWEQVKEMHKNGWDIQPHGMTHPSLPTLTAEKQVFEITEARRLIEEKIGVKADIYCYPYGHFNKDTLDVLTKHGFRYAFTIEQGKTASGQHPYKLTRIFVNGEEKLSALVHKLTKW